MKSLNFKLILGAIYLSLLAIGLWFVLSNYDISDFLSYEFIKINKDIILKYKNENFFTLAFIFFIFCIIWVLMLGFAMPLLIFSGFVFGKWWGIAIVLTSTTIGATLLYILGGLFFSNFVRDKLVPKFNNLKKFFNKNELIYFMCFRFVGGGGTPYAVQNVLPLIFNMSIKNYIIATFVGSMPSMFITVSLGSGIESVIDKNVEFNTYNVISSPEIYLPIVGLFVVLIMAFIIKKMYFKE